VGAYQSAAIDWVVITFMLIASLNFGLYYGLVRGRWGELWRNYELRFYLALHMVVIVVVGLCIHDRHASWLDTLRFSTFQTTAVTSTTGFMTEDYDTYPETARFALFLCMFIGGCAGSTAGGLKASRVYILLGAVFRELRASMSPNVVQTIKVGGINLPPEVLRGVVTFFVAYLLLFMVGSAALVAVGLDMVSAMTGVAASMSSAGPGLGSVGPAQNYGFVPDPGKAVLCICMIAGRLELFALFAVFTPDCWRR
jgi:trk system potassium uptake protein TrkH